MLKFGQLNRILLKGVVPSSFKNASSRVNFVRCIGNNNPAKMDGQDLDSKTHVHFRATVRPHPLNVKPDDPEKFYQDTLGDHTGRQQNHIWSLEELDEKMNNLYRHKPQTFSDHVMNKLMYSLYHTFNFLTGYSAKNPTVKAIQWRLTLLESIAGVPGSFVFLSLV
jgi:hypothetical protein